MSGLITFWFSDVSDLLTREAGSREAVLLYNSVGVRVKSKPLLTYLSWTALMSSLLA